MRCWLATLALFTALPAAAQKVYTCRDNGTVTYQSLPCPSEDSTLAARNVVRDPNLSSGERIAAQQRLRTAEQRMRAEAGRGRAAARPRGSVIEDLADPEGCRAERQRKEMAELLGRAAPDAQARLAQACRRP